MTVAMIDAAVMNRASRNVNITRGSDAQRLYTESGTRNIMMNVMQAPTRKRPNIQFDTNLINLSMSLTSDGRATILLSAGCHFPSAALTYLLHPAAARSARSLSD